MIEENKNSLKFAFIATLCKHPKAEDYQKNAFQKADIKGLYKKLKDAGEVITKADFLKKDEKGHCFLTFGPAWDNFHYIVDIIRENGEEFTAEDLLQISDDSYYKRPIIESMSSNRKLDVVFDSHVWKGRFEEMEDLWYYMPASKRREITPDNSEYIPLDLKREVLGLDKDAVLREDELNEIGVDYKAIPYIFAQNGAFDAFLQNLYENKMVLKTQDVLLVNREGDTMFQNASTWNAYDKIIDILKQNGEKFGFNELLFKRGRKPSILERGAQHGMLNKIFAPKLWQGKTEEMVKVWDKLLPAQRNLKSKRFDTIVADVENMTYGATVLLNAENVTKKLLLTPIIANDNTQTLKVIPLGLRDTWKYMDILSDGLKKKGESIDIDMLRSKSGALENTAIMVAAESDNFDKVLNILRENKGSLKIQDFLSTNKNDTSLLDILIEKKQLNKAFTPEIWAGRLQEMHILWNNVQERDKKQIDFSKLVKKVNHATIRQAYDGKRQKIGPKS